MRVIEYQVVVRKNGADLQDAINSYIRKGWVPQGGIYLHNATLPIWWCQAMVKYEEENTE